MKYIKTIMYRSEVREMKMYRLFCALTMEFYNVWGSSEFDAVERLARIIGFDGLDVSKGNPPIIDVCK